MLSGVLVFAQFLSPSLSAMASTTVNDFYVPYWRPEASDAERLFVGKSATVGWGLVQIALALAAQWMDQSVLSAGLAVLSVTAGPVLGAFLLGVATRRISAASVLPGMIAGIVAVGAIWWTGAVAWTWYAVAGATTTMTVACVVHLVSPAGRWARAADAETAAAPRSRGSATVAGPAHPRLGKSDPGWNGEGQ